MTTADAKIERQKNGRVVCTLTFQPEEEKSAEEQAFAVLAAEIKMPGFRPGKAPREKLMEKISAEALLERTVRTLVSGLMESLVKEHGIKTIMPPRIAVKSREPLSVEIVFVEKPAVTVKGADKIRIEKKEPAVKDEDTEKMARYILEKHETTSLVDRPAQAGDRVTIDFWGADEKGTEIPAIRTQGHRVLLGEKTLIPGFEDALLGLKKGDEKNFTLTFPEKYHAEELKGKPVTFHATVTQVEEVRVPELTDDFAAKHLGVGSAVEFRTKLKESMIAQEERLERSRREQQLMEAIRKATMVDLAPELIDEETESLLEDFARELKRQNRTIQEWLEAAKKKPEEFEKELKEQAKDRLTLRLGIRHLIDEKNPTVSDEEMAQTIASLLVSLPEQERRELEPAYAKGGRAWEQLLWQKKVEKLFSAFLD